MIYISHLLWDEEMREVIEKTGAGVESIDFSISENLDHLSESISSYKKRMKRMGTDDLILHGPFLDLNPMTYDSEIRRVTMMRYEQAYQAAVELGAKKIVYHSCLNPDAYLLIGWAERTAAFYREFLEGKKEVEVVLENVFDRVWSPLKETMAMAGLDTLHLCLDVGHAGNYSSLSEKEWAEALKNEVTHIHVHDNRRDRDSHLALGEGVMEWDYILDLYRGREDVTYTIECASKEAVEKSYEYLVRKLGKS